MQAVRRNKIDVETLAKNYDEYTVLDCRGIIEVVGLSEKLYNESHLPKAQLFPAEWLISEPQKHGGEDPLPKWDVFAKRLQSVGVDDEQKVVIYSSTAFADYAARLYWNMRYMGFKNVHMLEGGFKAWVDAGYEVTTEVVPARKAGKLTLSFQYDMYFDREDVIKNLKTKEYILVDARGYDCYLGTKESQSVGHIPGAYSVSHLDIRKGENSLDKDVIAEKVAFLKSLNKPIVTYCGGGITSAYLGAILDEYGLGYTMYVGSLSDWISYDNYPIEKGEGQ